MPIRSRLRGAQLGRENIGHVRRFVVAFGAFVALLGSAACIGTSAGGATTASTEASKSTPRPTSTEVSVKAASLQSFIPSTSRTWWAVVQPYSQGAIVARTVDSGRHWHEVWATPTGAITSNDFLNSEVAWIVGWVEQGSAYPPPSEPLYRTRDGGKSWQRLVNVPNGCQLDFVDQLHGWCTVIGAAAGSESFALYRTLDGGSTWKLASSTGLNDTGSTPGDVPFGCDKTISFTSASVGWISSWCNGGPYYLFTSDDGGSQWQRRRVPLPPGTSTLAYGSGLDRPVVAGDDVAASVLIGGLPGTTAVATSADGGLTWSTHVVPHPHEPWTVDLIDPAHWVLSDGNLLMATDDAGARWQTWVSPVKMKGNDGETLSLDFLNPSIGWAVPDPNGGPMWWTVNGGAGWRAVQITAGPYRIPTA